MRASAIFAKAATRAAWPLTRLDRNPDRLGPVVLCYHRVLPRGLSSQSNPYAITKEQFRDQMALLAREKFTSLTLEEFHEAIQGGRPFPRRAVLITFDDGFGDIYSAAWPIACRFGIKLNLFLCTGLLAGEQVYGLDEPPISPRAPNAKMADFSQALTWGEVRVMSAAGVGVGFHTHAHQNQARLSPTEISADATKGIALFTKQLGTRPMFFAFPYGHFGSYSAEAMSVLKEHGIQLFFTTELGRTPPNSQGAISRIVLHSEDDTESFRRKLYGGYDWVGKMRKLGYSMRASLSDRARTAAHT